MSLRLRIENIDSLPDGGPISFEVAERGLDIGRDPYLDWTLPDPDRFISGKHCEIRYRDGGYWLHDVSTNGTSLNGQGGRLTEPRLLQNGDRIHIGHYIIMVEVSEVALPASGAVAEADPGSAAHDPWGVESAAAAVDRRDFSAYSQRDREEARGPTDLSEENISWSVGEVTPGQMAGDDDIWGAPAGGGADDWGWAPPETDVSSGGVPSAPIAEPPAEVEAETAPAVSSVAPSTEPVPTGERGLPEDPVDPFAAPIMADPPTPIAGELDDAPASADRPASEAFMPPAKGDPFSTDSDEPASDPSVKAPAGLASRWAEGGVPEAAAPPLGQADQAAPTPPSAEDHPTDQTTGPDKAAAGIIAAFERGAGIPAGSVAEDSEEEFAEELGALFRLVTQNLQTLLAARAETKSAMRSADRTMIGALENNPLKFSPTAEDALRIMFGAKTRSYLDASETMEASFHDLQQHQVQTFAAMQQALQALIEDLDPASIEEATATEGGLAGIVGSRRARLWDTYVERFRAKSARHERGMVDSFMILFAEMYDRQR